MKKCVLIDGNNLLFRSFYATAYSGSILRNSKGFPTNALYGYINMLNKIIREESPSYVMVAFDKGKTFRHEKYKDYKEGRRETPVELKQQFPVAKEITKAMGLCCIEVDNYEADDIIGTFAKEVDNNDNFIATIISSDKDLLQLISNDCTVKLLKSNDFIMMDKNKFNEVYGLTPDKMIDLKALMGDSSDNIPGVKGIGEKTALNLLQKYGSLDGVYENIDSITGKTKEKLINDKDNAYFSYELATIYKDVPIDTNLESIKYEGITESYAPLLTEYEFFSILKKESFSKKQEDVNYKVIDSLDEISTCDKCSLYLEINGSYHDKDYKGLSIYDGKNAYYIDIKNIKNNDFFKNSVKKITYDVKRLITSLRYLNIDFNDSYDDIMLMSYLLNINIKDDITSLMSIKGYDVSGLVDMYKNKDLKEEDIINACVTKAKFIYDNYDSMYDELVKSEHLSLYQDIELPTSYVLSDMEYTGVLVSREKLSLMQEEIKEKLSVLEKKIYNIAGLEFNILSFKQLGKVLFEKLAIPYPKKIKDDNYSTSSDILNKINDYDIVKYVLEYRTLAKLYSNYAVGLVESIKEDGKIHTTFNQTLTRTGRLSSTNPNLQNIPVREEYSKLVRKAFIPSNDYIVSSDYSQIELRVFAHMSNASNLIDAFNSGIDIHTKTAMDIFHVDKKDVTPLMRRNAKAVNFGILYGISSFGLSEDLGINVKEAKNFIDNYLNTYPGIKDYMNSLISTAKKDGYVKTLFGRTRVIDELKSNNFMTRSMGERMALNTPIQGTSADILKKAMIEVYEEFKKLKLKSKMIIQVHDELLFDVYSDELETVKKVVKEKMEDTYKLNVPLVVDINCGKDWYDAK